MLSSLQSCNTIEITNIRVIYDIKTNRNRFARIRLPVVAAVPIQKYFLLHVKLCIYKLLSL